jgi:hypothetical protein
MFEVCKPKQKPVVLIRSATGNELTNYEKRKLANVEENAQENKIEAINLTIDGNKQWLEPKNKEVDIELGRLALKDTLLPTDLSSDETFFINCVLDDAISEQHD